MKRIVLVMFAMLLNSTFALANPQTLHFGSLDNGSFKAAPFLWSNELRPILSNSAAFQIQGGGNDGIAVDPFELFVGVAFAGSNFVLPDVIEILPHNGLAVTTNVAASYRASLTSSSADAYTLLGHGGANNSQNWSNWSGAYNALAGSMGSNGSFGIFEYQLLNTGLTTGQKPVGIEFAGNLPEGTFLFGYATLTATGKKGITETYYSTPFTEAGMTPEPTVPVPEPGTLLLLGFGMLGIAIFGKRGMNKET